MYESQVKLQNKFIDVPFQNKFWGFKKPGTCGCSFYKVHKCEFYIHLSRLDQTEKLDIPFLFR
jgi:hypothetical protein